MKTILIVHSLLVAAAVLVGGCGRTFGPKLVLNSHIDYNKAVSEVLKEELLLNVVRRRYLEPLQFVTASSISTSLDFSAETSASASADNGSGDTTKGFSIGGLSGSKSDVGGGLDVSNVGISGGVSFSDSPTITITPRQGEDIARQLHEPLAVSTVADLIAAGYPIEARFRFSFKALMMFAGRRCATTSSGRERRIGARSTIFRDRPTPCAAPSSTSPITPPLTRTSVSRYRRRVI